MKSCSLSSLAITTVSTSLRKSGFVEKNSAHGQLLRFPHFNKYPHCRKLRILDIKGQASGTAKVSSGTVEAISKEVDLKDDNLVFVAGATGRVGSRTVRELIKLGFRVRAGVRTAQKAETLVQSVKQMKIGNEGAQPVEKLEIVECDLEKPNQIGAALGNASVVICCIGASEKEVFDVTGPYRIDYMATKNLIDTANVAKAKHFIMVSSLGTNKVGFPAAILNLFWGVLIWKRKAELALIASGLPYTIVRPGGMERPTDAYKETHNMTLSEEDTLFGGQVSNLQVAELMAYMAKNRELSYCKVVEVIAETTAPLTPMDKLLEKIPSKRAKPKTPDAAKSPEPASSKAVEPQAPTSPTSEEPPLAKPVETRPLSPYTVYDDLKPPTSPTPTQPSSKTENSPIDAVLKPDSSDTQTSTSQTTAGATETKPAPVEAKTTRPLSPYAVYEDLKPPSSPSPTPSGPKEKPYSASPNAEAASPVTGGNDAANVTTISVGDRYDDLKPPASPSPSTPVGSIPVYPMDGGPKVGDGAPPPTAPSYEQQHAEAAEPKLRPLSPYTMYDDMKPPSSPTPSCPRI